MIKGEECRREDTSSTHFTPNYWNYGLCFFPGSFLGFGDMRFLRFPSVNDFLLYSQGLCAVYTRRSDYRNRHRYDSQC